MGSTRHSEPLSPGVQQKSRGRLGRHLKLDALPSFELVRSAINKKRLGRVQDAEQSPIQAKGKVCQKAYLYGQILRQGKMIL